MTQIVLCIARSNNEYFNKRVRNTTMPKDKEAMTSCLLDIRYRESNLETGTIAIVSVQEDSTISFGEVSITQHMKEKW